MVADRDYRPQLYGREAECEILAGLVERARRNQGAVLVVHGEQGIGKTALLDYVAHMAADVRVLRISGAESESRLVYAGLQQLCGSATRLLNQLPSPQREALEIAIGVRLGVAPNRLLVGLGVFGMLTKDAADSPLVCLVDDAHWLDRASEQALAFAARRLQHGPVLIVFASRRPGRELAGLPNLAIGGLQNKDAGELMASVVRWPLDKQVRAQILAEAQGNPRALTNMLGSRTPGQLAGGFGLPDAIPGDMPGGLVRQFNALPAQTRLLLAAAAADMTGDPALLCRVGGHLGIPTDAARPAFESGLLLVGTAVVFPQPATRVVAYQSIRPHERQAVHRALAQAARQPDRRAWHRAHAAPTPDEDVAAELERTADQAQARGGLPASAAFLGRAALLTPDAPMRSRRALAAAAAMLQIGELDLTATLLDVAEAGEPDEHQRGVADFLRARTVASRRLSDAPRLLLDAARRLDPFDHDRARAARRDAMSAAIYAAGLAARGGGAADVAQAVRRVSRPGSPGSTSLLLDGLARYLIDGGADDGTALKRALRGIGRDLSVAEELQWLPVACTAAAAVWDDQAWAALSARRIRLDEDAGALADLPQALSSLACLRLVSGNLASAESLSKDAQTAADAARLRFTPFGALGVAALRGRQDQAQMLIDRTAQDAAVHREGLGLAAANWAAALLHNGLSHYKDALAAAEEAVEHAGMLRMAGWAMAELIEAAVRTDQRAGLAEVLLQLENITVSAGTDWALGIRARSFALVADGEAAQYLYESAIQHLSRSLAHVDLARAHLLYGEWLRREARRVEARGQLRRAYDMLDAMGADAFAGRARRELLATGETVRSRTNEVASGLTPQEMQISVRVQNGSTNVEIAHELFLSPRTVEWHLRKVFRKLGISSRRQLSVAQPSYGLVPMDPQRATNNEEAAGVRRRLVKEECHRPH